MYDNNAFEDDDESPIIKRTSTELSYFDPYAVLDEDSLEYYKPSLTGENVLVEFGGNVSLNCCVEDVDNVRHVTLTSVGDGEIIHPQVIQKKHIKSPQDLIYILTLGMLCLFYESGDALMAPFFSSEAAKKDVSSTTVGWIFAIHPLFCFVLSPLAGKWLPVIGLKYALFAGTFLSSGSQILFGFTTDMPKNYFIIYCFLIRIVTAMGTALSETAVFAMVSLQFEDNLTAILGTLEVFTGVGLVMGPVLGGILYKVGGFGLPFFIVGGLNMLTLLILYFVLPKKKVASSCDITASISSEPIGSIFQALKVPAVAMLAIVSTSNAASFSSLDPTLATHLEEITKNGLTKEKIGLIFLIPAVCYMIVSPVSGWLIGNKFSARSCILIGLLGTSVAFLFIGPAPFLSLRPSLWLVCASLVIFGTSAPLFMIPILGDMLHEARRGGLPDTVATSSVVSGIYGGSSAIGYVIGPVLAGFLTDHQSFAWTMTYLMGFLGLEFFALLFFTCWEKKK